MARKSGWQQFADNFNAVYDAGTKFAKDRAFKNIDGRTLEEELNEAGEVVGYKYGDKTYDDRDDKGGLIRPSDEKLRLQNITDTQKAMRRFGDHKGAMEMGLNYAKLEAQQSANKLARDTHDFNVEQARLRNKEIIADTDKKVADTEAVVTDTGHKKDINPIKVEQAKEDVNKTITESAQLDANIGLIDEKTKGQMTANEQARTDAQNAADAYAINKPLNDALLEHANTKWDSPEDSKNALIEVYGLHGDKDGKGAALVKSMDAANLADIMRDAETNSAKVQAMLADPTLGVVSVADWINESDGIEGNNVQALVVDGKHIIADVWIDELTGKAHPLEPYYVTGDTAEELRSNVQQYATPGGSVELANQMATFRKNKAGLGKTKAETKKLNADAAGGGRDYKGELNVKSMNEFTKDPAGVYQRALRAAQKSGKQSDWDLVYKIETDHQELLNRAGSKGGLGKGTTNTSAGNGGFSGMRKSTK